MKKIDGDKILVKVPYTDLERLDKVMKRHGLTRAEAIRNVLSMGLDLYEDLSHLGIPQAVALFDGVKGSLRNPGASSPEGVPG